MASITPILPLPAIRLSMKIYTSAIATRIRYVYNSI